MSRRRYVALLITAIFLGGPTTVAATTVQDRVPVHLEPRHHLVLDRADLRVLDVQIPPGDTTLFHTHDAPIHYVTIGSSQTTFRAYGDDWPAVRSTSGARAQVGTAFWNLDYGERPLTHQVANIGDRLFRLIAVINRGDGSTAAPALGEAPGTLEAESTWFLRSRVVLPPGGGLELGAESGASVLIQVSPGAVRLSGPSGELHGGPTSSPGDWLLHVGGEARTLANTSDEPVTLVVVRVR